MNALFQGGPDLDVRTRNGRNVMLLGPKIVVVEEDDGTTTRYLMETDGNPDDSDGASMPWIARVLGLEPYGLYWPGAVFHDRGFRRKLKVWQDGAWVPTILSMERLNRIFDALNFSTGLPLATRKIIFEALEAFGEKAYEEDGRQAEVSAK